MLLVVAVLLMCIGHFFKIRRWKQFIEIYEKPHVKSLYFSMGIGQLINSVVPFRLGDVARTFLSGRHMSNKYVLAFSTIVVGIYLDVLTVGAGFGFLFLLGKGGENVRAAFRFYGLLFLALVILTFVFFKRRIILKRIIRRVASVFNSRIEMLMLLTAYSCIDLVKGIYTKISKRHLVFNTLGMWGMYMLSYLAFAETISKSGINYSLTEVVLKIFSQTELWRKELFEIDKLTFVYFPFVIYTLAPTFILLFVSFFMRKETLEYSRKILPQLNENDKLSFLDIYFSEKDRNYIKMYLDINRDVTVLQDYSAGSNATTILCMNETETFFRKYAFGKDAGKLEEQIVWLEENKNILPLPTILRKNVTDDYCSYDMPYSAENVGFFKFLHSVKYETSWSILSNALNEISSKLHVLNRSELDQNILEKYIDQKVIGNIKLITQEGGKYIKQLMTYDILIINGEEYPNINFYSSVLSKENLMSIFNEDYYSEIHGDFTIENIICSNNNEEIPFYFIDPNGGNMHNTPFLDYSKLLQSIHGGYEFLMMVKNVVIQDNKITFLSTKSSFYNRIYQDYLLFLKNQFTEKEVKSIFFHEIVHWLRLMPYKIRKNEKLAVVFYSGLLMVMNDVFKMFEESK